MKKTFIKTYLLICAFMLMGASAFAQASVSGSVTDALSGEPLAGVKYCD